MRSRQLEMKGMGEIMPKLKNKEGGREAVSDYRYR